MGGHQPASQPVSQPEPRQILFSAPYLKSSHSSRESMTVPVLFISDSCDCALLLLQTIEPRSGRMPRSWGVPTEMDQGRWEIRGEVGMAPSGNGDEMQSEEQ